jgi:hypothetical protein
MITDAKRAYYRNYYLTVRRADLERHKSYNRLQMRTYRATHPEKVAAAHQAFQAWKRKNHVVRARYIQRYQLSDKEAVVNMYTNGEATCRHCGHGDLDVLCIDHIANNGAQHRKAVGYGSSFIRWLITHDYPAGFQVLCANCNLKKELLRRRTKKAAGCQTTCT